MPSYRVSLIPRLRRSARRAIALLGVEGDASVDAAACFSSLAENHERTVRTRMDAWIDGHHNDKWFHGWPQEAKYKECFVFKWDEKKVHQRLYGFLCHPSKTNPGFQLCVLCFHDTKTQSDTDFAILDRINALRVAAGVLNAISSELTE